jgi:hypothetical protein
MSILNLQKNRRAAVFTVMKRARNKEFKDLWNRIYKKLLKMEQGHNKPEPDWLDSEIPVCADISARNEFEHNGVAVLRLVPDPVNEK